MKKSEKVLKVQGNKKRIINNDVKIFRNQIINLRQLFAQEKQRAFLDEKARILEICAKLKKRIEFVNPGLIYKSLSLDCSYYLN